MIACKHEKTEITEIGERVCCICGVILAQVKQFANENIRHVQKDDEQKEKIRWGYGYPSSLSKFLLGTDRGYFNQNNIISLCKVVYRIYRYIMHYELNNTYVNFNDEIYLIILDRVLWHATHREKSRFYRRFSNRARIMTTLAILKSTYSTEMIKKRLEKMRELYSDAADSTLEKCFTLLESSREDKAQLLQYLP